MKKGLIYVVIILGISLAVAISQLNITTQKWKDAEANVKAYSMELSNEKDKSTAYKLSIDQLEYFKDSVIKELDETRKELKIKDKNLKALQAISSTFLRTDTITFNDTIFNSSSVAMDTTIQDEWYSLKLGLAYPSSIAVTPCFVSKKHVIVSSRKETVNPPKKFFLARWFQRKHYVLQIDVVEKNPYVKNQSSKYIEIIK